MRAIAFTTAVLASSAAHAAGMPQMDPTWFTNGFLWLVVSFAVLYIGVAYAIVPSIRSVLAQRESAIGEAIREAEKAKLAAESTAGNADSTGQDARIKAAEIMAQLQAEISRDASEAIAKLDRELNRKADQAAAALQDVVKKASTGIDAAAQDLATAMTEKLLGTAAPALKASGGAKLKVAAKRKAS